MDAHAITNPKIAGLEPTWRTWRGVSVLFDNPGLLPGPRLDDATAAGVAEQRLYDDLSVLVDAARPPALRAGYGFCPLPRSTYHVTVCDGPNEEELARTKGSATAEVAALIATLPDSLGQVPAALEFAEPDALLRTAKENPVTLAAQEVVIWGSVLAARLGAADGSSAGALERITGARQVVAAALSAALGMAAKAWRPHVSLGYFANHEAADRARENLAVWNQWLAASEPASITYRSAALYGFTDMVSFFRVGS